MKFEKNKLFNVVMNGGFHFVIFNIHRERRSHWFPVFLDNDRFGPHQSLNILNYNPIMFISTHLIF